MTLDFAICPLPAHPNLASTRSDRAAGLSGPSQHAAAARAIPLVTVSEFDASLPASTTVHP